jgi:hypothetical protein
MDRANVDGSIEKFGEKADFSHLVTREASLTPESRR